MIIHFLIRYSRKFIFCIIFVLFLIARIKLQLRYNYWYKLITAGVIIIRNISLIAVNFCIF